MKKLTDQIIFITGGSRGVGREMALRFAADGAKIVIAAKTDLPHPTLPGTIYTVADEIKALGGEALPLKVDVRDEAEVEQAVEKTVATWGRIDVLINNASAIFLAPTLETPMKRFDLISAVNVRGTFLCSKACVPYLKKSANPHILNISPPLNMQAKWFKDHLAYTISKYGMSMCTLGMSLEFKPLSIAVNSLWPKSTLATAAIKVNFPKEIFKASRHPKIMADAAYEIISAPAKETTGHFFVDEDLLREKGTVDFSQYTLHPGVPLFADLFLEGG